MRPETGLLELLPYHERAEYADIGLKKFTRQTSQRLLLVLSGSTNQLDEAERSLRDVINANSLLQALEDPSALSQRWYSALSEHVGELSGRHMDEWHSRDRPLEELVQQARRNIYGFFSWSLHPHIDPLQLISRRLGEIMESSKSFFPISLTDTQQRILAVELLGDPFAEDFQNRMDLQLRSWADFISRKFPGIALEYTGTLRFAMHSTRAAKREATWFGGMSLLIVFLLQAWTFRSWRALWLCLFPLGIGLFCAYTLTQLIFGRIHIITLTFGGSLIGIGVDYIFHYLCHQRQQPDAPLSNMNEVWPGMCLGWITTIMGFASLLWLPLPGPRQMAVFAIAGISAVLFTVIAFLPHMNLSTPQPPSQWKWSGEGWMLKSWPRTSSIVALILIILYASGSRIHISDDIRDLQPPPEEMLRDHQRLLGANVAIHSSSFFIISGRDDAEVLKLEEQLCDLFVAEEAGTYSDLLSLSHFIPSPERQIRRQQDLKTWTEKPSDILNTWLDEIHLTQDTRTDFFLRLQRPPNPLTLDQARHLKLLGPLIDLDLGTIGDQKAHIVLLQGAKDPFTMLQLSHSIPGVTFMNLHDHFSSVLALSRHLAVRVLFFVSLAIGFLLYLSLRLTIAQTLRLLSVPLLTLLLTPAILACCGQNLHAMTLSALLLAFGVGLDYSIFLALPQRPQSTSQAICLSAATTILALGLLSFSSIPVLRSLGLTVSLSVALALFFSHGLSQPIPRKAPLAG